MCGIIGTSKQSCTEADEGALRRGLATLSKRGPDAEGVQLLKGALFGHRRLSIVDLAGGAQPMKDSTGNFLITFNGEIYNYPPLRSALERAGHIFRTQSDTEVILEAYKAYGSECVRHLDGMFAFAIWDEQKKELFMARDRFGEKPLYYATQGDALWFASEIKALLAGGQVRPELDRVSIDNYFALGYVPPWRTIYGNIHTLPPAHYAFFKNGTFTKTQYWQLRNRPEPFSFSDAAERVRELVTASVTSRLIADVEVGSFLSGGVDSSIITTLAQESVSPQRIKTFSAGFEDFINELPYAKELAESLNTDHHETHIRMHLTHALQETAAYFDEPFADSSSIPTHLLSQFARQEVPVALSGDGGDELFFGYGHYRRQSSLSLRGRVREHFTDPFKNHPRHVPKLFSEKERQALFHDSGAVEPDLMAYLDVSEAQTDLQKVNLIDLQLILPGDILTKVDRASMMHSLEVRSPFLQHQLAEFVYNLPDEYKTNAERGKLLLAHAFSDRIPKHFFERKKQGFGAPIAAWLKKPELYGLVHSTLSSTTSLYTFLREERVRSYVDAFYGGDDRLARRVWAILTFALWLTAHPKNILRL